MQNNKGKPFASTLLDRALKEQISEDNTKNSTRLLIKRVFDENIDWKNKIYPESLRCEFENAILSGKLPKFDRYQDNFNGMGITVHDTWSTHITLKKIDITENNYRATVHYKIQDHFGLDPDDILKYTFHSFRFFRIWFVLQHYNKLSYRPFITNMSASIEITGSRNENRR